MAHPTTPDPDAVARGADILEHELRRSLIMPRPAETFRTILQLLDSAYLALHQPADAPTPPRPGSRCR